MLQKPSWLKHLNYKPMPAWIYHGAVAILFIAFSLAASRPWSVLVAFAVAIHLFLAVKYFGTKSII